jgi:hypothetical protein
MFLLGMNKEPAENELFRFVFRIFQQALGSVKIDLRTLL